MNSDFTAVLKDKRRMPLFLALIFLASVLVRLPYLGRPMSSHHEWLTSTSLIHIQAFYEQGFGKLYFSPCMSYPNAADKNINFHANLADRNGNMFYLSFPPFAFLLPAFVFKAVHVYPTPLGLQIFNLFFHFIGCWFIYLILKLLTGGKSPGKEEMPAVLGFLVYCFSPSTLWFQSNVYMSDMFVQTFFIAGIWLFLKLREPDGKKWPYLALYGMNLFLCVYTEWLGVFFAAVAFLLVLFDLKKKGSVPLLAVTAVCVIAPLALTLWQYSLISGFSDMLNYMKNKFLYRTGDPRYAFGAVSFLRPTAWANILVNYIGGFLPAILLAVVLAFRAGKKRAGQREKWSAAERTAVVLSLAPALIHNFVFFNFTSIHDFSALKGGVFIAIIAGILYHKLLERSGGKPPEIKKALPTALSLFALSLLMYYVINGFDAHGRFQAIGDAIRKDAKPDEVVFLADVPYPPNPQIIVYARRSIAFWPGKDEALKLIRKNGVEKGVLYTVGADQKTIAATTRFSLNGK